MSGAMVPSVQITTAGREGPLMPVQRFLGSISGLGGSVGVWLTANLAIAVPVDIPSAVQVRQLGWINGATASGNVDVGIYRHDGSLVISSGSTAQTGTTIHQVVNITDTSLPPGSYYLALVMDGTTGTYGRFIVAQIAAVQASGVCHMASAFPLPSTFVFASPGNTHIPFIAAITGRFA